MFAQVCGEGKPDVIRTNGELAMIAIDECCNSESLQVSIQQEARGINECFSAVKDIIDEHDILSFHTLDLEEAKAEIGYWVSADVRGKGIATQATKLLTEYGFESIGFHRIEALVVESNKPSLKVLVNAGYVQEGVLRDKSCCGDGTRENMVMFAAIRSDWSA